MRELGGLGVREKGKKREGREEKVRESRKGGDTADRRFFVFLEVVVDEAEDE